MNVLTQGCRVRSNPGLELANAFGVKATSEFSLNHCLRQSPALDFHVLRLALANSSFGLRVRND